MAEIIGSYNNFLTENGVEDTPEAKHEYNIVLASVRQIKAQKLNITLEELHDIILSDIE